MRLFSCGRIETEDEENSKEIDKEIKNWIKSYNDAIKLLLLGTGESGKTTIIKQMKILHVQGFSPSERTEKIKYIRHNIHESIHDINLHMAALSIGLQNRKNVQAQQYILKCGLQGPPEYDESFEILYEASRHGLTTIMATGTNERLNVPSEALEMLCSHPEVTPRYFPQQYFDYVRALWRDGGVKECFQRSNEYQLIDSAEYFLDRIDLVEKSDYVPTDADILRCRQKTTGIQKIEFKVKVPKAMHGGVQDFWMFDVGGQRGERKKWIQVFEGIHAIWFVVGCSDFDQRLREDATQNRLREAVELFEDVWQSRFLLEAGLIVFLNKQDLLEQKIKQGKSIGQFFPEYARFAQPGDEYTRTKMFIRNMFAEITTKKRERQPMAASAEKFIIAEGYKPRECFFHFTTATDTDNVRTVFRDVHQIILKHILTNIGLF